MTVFLIVLALGLCVFACVMFYVVCLWFSSEVNRSSSSGPSERVREKRRSVSGGSAYRNSRTWSWLSPWVELKSPEHEGHWMRRPPKAEIWYTSSPSARHSGLLHSWCHSSKHQSALKRLKNTLNPNVTCKPIPEQNSPPEDEMSF